MTCRRTLADRVTQTREFLASRSACGNLQHCYFASPLHHAPLYSSSLRPTQTIRRPAHNDRLQVLKIPLTNQLELCVPPTIGISLFMNPPSSLTRDISPPLISKRLRSRTTKAVYEDYPSSEHARPSLAAIEAGEVCIRDHLSYFASRLQQAIRPPISDTPRLSISEFESLYQRNESPLGRHFVVHQHDHPISGTST